MGVYKARLANIFGLEGVGGKRGSFIAYIGAIASAQHSASLRHALAVDEDASVNKTFVMREKKIITKININTKNLEFVRSKRENWKNNNRKSMHFHLFNWLWTFELFILDS